MLRIIAAITALVALSGCYPTMFGDEPCVGNPSLFGDEPCGPSLGDGG